MTAAPDASGPADITARSMLPAAAGRFGTLVHAVPAAGWDRPTPCSGWSVRDLVNHLVAAHLRAPLLLSGGTRADVGDRYDGDVLGDRPAAAWDAAITASMRSWAMAREDQEVDLSAGPTPAGEYAEQMLLDLVVHAWDLARGAGLDERLPQDAVEHALGYAREHAEEFQGSGMFADPVPTDSPDPQTQLLALLGRRT
jgi:uncharacterized protein (TIGR03086 family)